MKIALIDFEDSFTYNLFHLYTELHQNITIINFKNINKKIIEQYEAFILSPGSETPNEKIDFIHFLKKIININKPIIGICLGCQIIAHYFHHKLSLMNFPQHGMISKLKIVKNDIIFNKLPKIIYVGRYHSWKINIRKKSPLKILAISQNDLAPMIIKHKLLPIYGFQFHPESIITPNGKQFIKNWINLFEHQIIKHKTLI